MKHVQDPSLIAKIGVRREAQIAGNGISGDEANPVNVSGQLVGILGDDLDGLVSVLFVDLHCVGRRDIVPPKEQHDFLDGLLCLPRALDHGDPALANAGNLNEARARVLNDLKRL